MQTFTTISVIINIGLIILCLSLVYPKAIQVYRKSKKRRETQEYTRIKQIVNEYLNELKND